MTQWSSSWLRWLRWRSKSGLVWCHWWRIYVGVWLSNSDVCGGPRRRTVGPVGGRVLDTSHWERDLSHPRWPWTTLARRSLDYSGDTTIQTQINNSEYFNQSFSFLRQSGDPHYISLFVILAGEQGHNSAQPTYSGEHGALGLESNLHATNSYVSDERG